MSSKPVIVYGANGYTGRLVCEFLRRFNIPFVAAGRNRERLEEALKLGPGESADFEIVEVEHETEALARSFSGAKVVCNIVGPFMSLGSVTVEAALRAGCHYLDTTGEQPFLIEMRNRFGAEFRSRGLLLAPSVAYMNAVLELACRACEEHSEIDTIEATCSPTGTPTFASTQTIFQSVRATEYYLEGGALKPWPPAHSSEVTVPSTDRTLLGMPWSGTPLPVWYEDHPRIRNVRTITAFTSRELMMQVFGIYQHYHANLASLPADEQEAQLAHIASGIQAGMPPRENPLVHRNCDSAIGSGSLGCVRYTVYSNCAYQQTGLLQAFAASWLLKQPPAAAGFQSPASAFGAGNILGALERFGYARMVREA